MGAATDGITEPRPWYFLRVGSDCLQDSDGPYRTRRAAIARFRSIARDLARFGQSVEASIHVAGSRDALEEYPEYVCSGGPRGGIRVERA